jgi:hypothetical protein
MPLLIAFGHANSANHARHASRACCRGAEQVGMKQESLHKLRPIALHPTPQLPEDPRSIECPSSTKANHLNAGLPQPVDQRPGIACRLWAETIHHGFELPPVQPCGQFDQALLGAATLQFGNAQRQADGCGFLRIQIE